MNHLNLCLSHIFRKLVPRVIRLQLNYDKKKTFQEKEVFVT